MFELTEFDLDNIGSWPKNVKMACIVFVTVIVLLIGYWLDLKSTFSDLVNANHVGVQLQHDLKTAKQIANQFPGLSSQVKGLQKSFNHLLIQLPTHTNMPEFLDALSDAGVTTGIQFLLFRPLPEEKKDIYVALPIELSVVGSYHQLASFVAAIASLNRMITVRDFTITSTHTVPEEERQRSGISNDEISDHLKLNMILLTYQVSTNAMEVMSPNESVLTSTHTFVYQHSHLRSPFQKNISPGRENAAVEIRKEHYEALEKYPLDTLQMVGSLSNPDRQWGLVAANDGLVYRVKKGDLIGQHHGVITAITKNKIFVTEIINEEGVWKKHETELVLIDH